MVLDTRQQLMHSITQVFPDVSERKVNRIYRILKPKGKNSDAYKADGLIRLCCKFFDVEISKIKAKDQKQELADQRHMMMAAIYENLSRCSQEKLGEKFNRKRTAIIHAKNKVKNLCETDEDFRRTYQELNDYIFKN
jgi:chromosomal replication initiation ATPase DnaA